MFVCLCVRYAVDTVRLYLRLCEDDARKRN